MPLAAPWWVMPDSTAALPPPLAQGAWWTNGARLSLSRFVLEVRHDMPGWKQALIVGASILAGIFISAVILAVAGVPAGDLASELGTTVLDRQSFHAVLV